MNNGTHKETGRKIVLVNGKLYFSDFVRVFIDADGKEHIIDMRLALPRPVGYLTCGLKRTKKTKRI